MRSSKILNVPNILSLARVFLAPFVLLFISLRLDKHVPFLDLSWGDLLAAIVFIIAGITDALDGYIARKHKIITTLGIFIDSLADKVLVIAAMLALIESNRLPAWIAMVIITREFVVTGFRLVAAAEKIIVPASKLGKLKTVIQIIALTMLILNMPYAMRVMWLAVFITVWSGMDYLIKGSKILTGDV